MGVAAGATRSTGTVSRWLIAKVAAATALSGMLALTLAWRAWIERLFGFDPDGGNGSLELAIVVVLALTSALCTLAAARDWRHRRASA